VEVGSILFGARKYETEIPELIVCESG